MDSVLKALGRNKIPSDADQDGMETKNGGRDRAISSTNYDLYNDDGELIDPKSEENRKDEVKPSLLIHTILRQSLFLNARINIYNT